MRIILSSIESTCRHTCLLKVKLRTIREEVETVLDIRGSTLVMGKQVACNLGICKKVRKIKRSQKEKSFWCGYFVIYGMFKIIDLS